MLKYTTVKSFKTTLVFIMLVSFMLSSCSTKIKSIYTNIEKYDGKEVTIKGKVENTTDILIIQYYYLDDNSGKKMRVVTDKELPKEGDVIKVTGIVNQRFKIGEYQWIVLKEAKDKE